MLHEIFVYMQGRHYLEFIDDEIKLYDSHQICIGTGTQHIEMFTSFENIFVCPLSGSERIASDLLRMTINDIIDKYCGYHTGWDFVTARVLTVDDIGRIHKIGDEYEFKINVGYPEPTKTLRGILIGCKSGKNVCGRTACLLDDKLICNGMAYTLKMPDGKYRDVCPFIALTTESSIKPIKGE